jgi:signal peptidase I
MAKEKQDIEESEETEKPQTEKKGMKDMFDSLVVAFVIAMVIRTFLISAYKIPSGSMLDTIQIGDHILANKLSYIVGKPEFGDIAVFEYPLEPRMDFIKRVIGEPGDVISMEDRQIYRNGELLDEPYTRFTRSYGGVRNIDNIEEFTVPEGMYLMLGDNRDNSQDGRYWGFVPEDAFKGKALFIYWSKQPGGKIRWERLFQRVR